MSAFRRRTSVRVPRPSRRVPNRFSNVIWIIIILSLVLTLKWWNPRSESVSLRSHDNIKISDIGQSDWPAHDYRNINTDGISILLFSFRNQVWIFYDHIILKLNIIFTVNTNSVVLFFNIGISKLYSIR